MRKFLWLKVSILFFLLVTINLADSGKYRNLMPVPEKITFGDQSFHLKDDFKIRITGKGHERIYLYATQVLRRLSGRTGLFFTQNFITPTLNEKDAQLIITIIRPARVVLYEDESYSLDINESGFKINSETDLGAMRGLETLLQLLDADESGYYFPEVSIQDKPRFPWRGLMIDVSRHFMPVDVIKRNLDGLAAVKMNVFHWHLSDDQGFRVESKNFPKLHQLSSNGLYYTHEQVKEILKYAEDRGIRVVPEFDIPGHSSAALTAYPELASAPGKYEIETKWGVFDPVFDPTNEETYKFFDKLLTEMASLFPDEYFHIGGDENNGVQWDKSEKIQEFKKKNNITDNHALQAYFNNRILKILTRNNKKMIGWDEILHPEMPTDIVIQSWRGTDALVQAAQKGYMGMLSNGYYIDLMQPAEFHYLNDPIPAGSKLTEAEKKKILGGETTMWAEYISSETIDSRIWPRTAAIAERFWSPQEIKDVDDMYRRMQYIGFRLEELGLTHIKNTDMLLRRLSNNQDVSPLRILVEAVEPLENYQRGAQEILYTSYSPLTRVVDAATADAMMARKFKKVVGDFTSGNLDSEKEIREYLVLWRDNHHKIVELTKKSPILKEIEPLSYNLSMLAEAGIQSLDKIKSKTKGDDNWIKEKTALLETSKKSYGQVEIVIISAIEKLIKQTQM